MGIARGWWIAVVVALAVGAGACGRSRQADQMAALDRMFQAGLLTKAEYEAKKATLQHTAEALVALDNALRAGVLTKDEYQAKRAALLGAGAPARSGGVSAAAQDVATPSLPAAPPQVASPAATPMETANGAAAPGSPPVIAAVNTERNPPSAAAPAAQPSGGAHANYLVLKKVTLMDQNGFERPIPSASLLIPTDWQYQGATQWVTKDLCNGIQTTFRASGPDGRAYELFPNYNWSWADDPTFLKQDYQQKARMGTKTCDVMPPMGAADFLRRSLPRLRPNAQLAGIEPMPKDLQTMQQQARQTEQMAMQYNMRQQVRPDIARARLRYSLNGKPVEECIVPGGWNNGLYVIDKAGGRLDRVPTAAVNEFRRLANELVLRRG